MCRGKQLHKYITAELKRTTGSPQLMSTIEI